MSSPFYQHRYTSRSRSRSIVSQGSTIGEHALRLVVQIQQQQPRNTPGWWIFQFAGRMIASCIFYDCQKNRRGRIGEIFDSYYRPSLRNMLEKFCDDYWPCYYIDRSGRRCASVKGTHHPDEYQMTASKVIGSGSYQTDFSAASYEQEWMSYLKEEIHACQEEYWEALDETPLQFSNERIASDLHLEQMNDFYTDLGDTRSLISHASCFCCLVEIPRHPLPCGHVLCDNCARDYGRETHTEVQFDCCPLHTYTSFSPSWEITFEPEQAGVRILCLDGGGIRGIVELEVLHAIEEVLGGHIAIQAFFDLIVGTSTGGINALALGVKQWPVKYCISMFETFCEQAFTEREFNGIPGLEHAAVLNHGSIYKAKPLYKALQETLGRDLLFGGNDSLNAFRTKVAITATSGDGKEAVVIANYNRSQEPTESHVFLRPDNPSRELELWQVAAATAAAPFYFKHFVHSKTGHEYLDGGLYHNNPIHVANRERKMLWPEKAGSPPDLLLSVGTGQNLSDNSEEASTTSKTEHSPQGTPKRSKSGIRRAFGTLEALHKRFDSILDAEQTWTDFETDIDNSNLDSSSPYVRFNLDLKRKPPPFDAKDKLKELKRDVKDRLRDPEVVELMHHVAGLLVASSFYFQVKHVVPKQGGKHVVTGRVVCKFKEGSSNLRALGLHLQRQRTTHFTPHFLINETAEFPSDGSIKMVLSDHILQNMATYGMFRLPPLEIEVPHPMASTTISLALNNQNPQDGHQKYLLSGFPRTLIKEPPFNPPIPHQTPATSPEHATRHQKPEPCHRNHKPNPRSPNQYIRPSVNHTTKISSPPYQKPNLPRTDSGLELPESLRVRTPPRKN